jgi:hypothetical protein
MLADDEETPATVGQGQAEPDDDERREDDIMPGATPAARVRGN